MVPFGDACLKLVWVCLSRLFSSFFEFLSNFLRWRRPATRVATELEEDTEMEKLVALLLWFPAQAPIKLSISSVKLFSPLILDKYCVNNVHILSCNRMERANSFQ